MPRSLALRIGIVVLCVWHMTAVFLFAAPSDKLAVLDAAKGAAMPVVRPYMLALSQWQQWNLFAPDPLRRVTTYRIDRLRDGRWELVQRIGPGTFPWHRHASWFKYFTGIIDDDGERMRPVQERFLELSCARLGMLPDTQLRLTLERRVLPHHEEVADVSWWMQANLPATDVSVATHTCAP